MQKIAGDIHLFKDSCNVYVIKNGSEAVLIDFGSGAVLDELAGIGVEKISAVYLTAARRDRCAGIDKLPEDVSVYGPDKFAEFINQYSVIDPDNPLLYPKFPGIYELPRYSLRCCETAPLKSYFAGWRIGVMPCTNSKCECFYTLENASRMIVFSSDAIYAPGKFFNPYHMEHLHHTGAGQREAADALRMLNLARPDILCPAHGEVVTGFAQIRAMLTEGRGKLLELADMYDVNCRNVRASRRIEPIARKAGFMQISEHIYMRGNVFVVLSANGKSALLVDFYCESDAKVEKFVNDFKSCFGARKIEKVLISHRHHDHWMGLNKLRDYFDFKIGCSEEMADDLENPLAMKRPFMAGPPVTVDCRFADGEKFIFHEYEFTSFYLPGQTDMHSGYLACIDGKKVFFSGDNFYPSQQWGGTGGYTSFNGGDPQRGWKRSIRLLLELEPDWMLASHSHPFEFDHDEFKEREKWCDDIYALMQSLVPEAPCELYFNMHTFSAFPFIQKVGKKFLVRFKFRNFDDHEHTVKVKAVTPRAVRSLEPDYVEIAAAADSTGAYDFDFELTGVPGKDTMISFDIYYDDQYLGERSEAFFYV